MSVHAPAAARCELRLEQVRRLAGREDALDEEAEAAAAAGAAAVAVVAVAAPSAATVAVPTDGARVGRARLRLVELRGGEGARSCSERELARAHVWLRSDDAPVEACALCCRVRLRWRVCVPCVSLCVQCVL